MFKPGQEVLYWDDGEYLKGWVIGMAGPSAVYIDVDGFGLQQTFALSNVIGA